MQVRITPLRKLRFAFIAIGLFVCGAVAALVLSSARQLQEQRRLRHQVVAERVFDEVERDLGSVLNHELSRPPAAYDAGPTDTEPSKWAPYIIAYYHRGDGQIHLVAGDKISGQRRKRALAAIQNAAAGRQEATAQGEGETAAAFAPDDGETSTRSPDVLRQLNRGERIRDRRQHQLRRKLQVVSLNDGTLVIERQSETQTRAEGFVVDVPAMIATIQSSVLGTRGLDTVASLSSAPGVPPTSASQHRSEAPFFFTHQLAAPLESLHVSLRLSRLADQEAGSSLLVLTPVLLLMSALGLFSIYRTVAIQLAYSAQQDNFVAAVTHELKTPLTAIRMYGEMLRDGMVDGADAKNEYYRTITAEGERLTRLVNNVMEHGKLRRGQRQTRIVPTDLGALVQEVASFMGPHFDQAGFEFELRVSNSMDPVAVDPDALKQVLYNILENATKYGAGEDVQRVVLEWGEVDRAAHIKIRDFGPGVPPENLKRIFQPFFRGQNELTRNQKGTGIGLSLVRDLVSLMDGTVEVRNRNPGFEVVLQLPLAV